ncbi:MAG: metallophosphoesterase [Flavobacteriales bacterium]|nr:metallophosphoesterase [Flavobacteriales bacterium]
MRRTAFGILSATAIFAQAQISPFNQRTAVPPDSSGNYRLLIGGHLHGASSNVSGYPASTVLASIDAINGTGANAFLSTGDLFLHPDRDSAQYVNALFRELALPLFNAPGNHDLHGSAFAGSRRMPVLLKFGKDRVLLLDTERDDGRLKGEQAAALNALAEYAAQAAGANMFIISHRPIWSEGDDRYSSLFSGNTRSLLNPDFHADVLPVLRRISRQGQVFWISGSMAGRAPSSIFFQPEEEGITYIQCAVRDERRDALLIADVKQGVVQWTAMSLTGQELAAPETYDAAWWRLQQGTPETFNWRLMPYLVKKNLIHPAFSYGVISTVIVMLVIFLLRRRR